MPLNPQVKALLEQMEAAGEPPLHTLQPEEARRRTDFRPLAGEPEPVAKVEERLVSGDAGYITIRVYTPQGNGPFPVLVYFHGGGWVIGDLDTVDAPCRALTNAAQCVVVSVDYRLAPEYKFPAAAEDAYAAVRWVAGHAAEINADPRRIAVGGDSAGGNLAAVAALMARDRGGPALLYQVLIYPVTHYAFDTASYRENGEGYMLTRDSMVWFWHHYLEAPEQGKSPYASPLLADNLSDLPPALVITAEYDPLRDEGGAYATRLREAGVPVIQKRYDGTIHGFFWMAGVLEEGRKAMEEVAQRLRETFNKPFENA
jgi:acetyl esterase